MAANFQIIVKSLPVSPDGLSESEARTFCDLEIKSRDVTLTRNIDLNKFQQDSVQVSVLPLAWWLGANFWRLNYEPGISPARSVSPFAKENWRLSHCMLAIGEGYIWPDITFTPDGADIFIQARRQDGNDYPGQGISFIHDWQGYCPKDEFVASIWEFLNETVERITNVEPDFIETWAQLQKDCGDQEIANYRILEAMLGYDIGYAPEKLMQAFINVAPKISWNTLCELAGGLNPVYGVPYENQRLGVERAFAGIMGGQTVKIDVPSMQLKGHLPWEIGKNLAQSVRKYFGLSFEQPVGKNKLLDWMGLTVGRFNTIKSGGPVSLSKVNGQKASLVFPARRKGNYADIRLFQLARALGGILSLQPGTSYMAMSASQTAEQQIQRNFAAELLAPFEAIKSMLPAQAEPTKKVIQQIATHFQTSAQTIVYSLINNGELGLEAAPGLLA